MFRFANGQQLLDFLFVDGLGPKKRDNTGYLLLLHDHIPEINGIKLLEKIKQDEQLKQIPVIMLTTADEPDMTER